MPIFWSEFSWEAFSTLATGVLALGAAIYIGRKQASILQQQNRIEDLRLRGELFDRRSKLYADVREWITYSIQHGKPPPEDSDVSRSFRDAIEGSRFIFNQSVTEELKNWWQLGLIVNLHDSLSEHKKAGEARKELLLALQTDRVFELFRPDMSLTPPVSISALSKFSSTIKAKFKT